MDTHSLGLYLRDAREAKELTLDDAVDHLKIRRAILESFEQGDFAVTDASPVQVKGFLRNYADYLNLDPDLVVQYYDAATEPRRGRRRRERPQEKPPSQSRLASQELPAVQQDRPDTQSRRASKPETMSERRKRSRRRRSGLLNTLIIIFVAIVSITVILFVVTQLLEAPQNDLLSDSQAVAQRGTPTPGATIPPTATISSDFVTLPEFQQDFDGRGVAVTLQVEQRMWMRLTVDGSEPLGTARLYVPGETANVRADSEIIVHTSNAAGLVIFYNGQIQGSYGGRGQQAEVAFRADGVEIITSDAPEPTTVPPTDTPPTATETIVPTATPEPLPSATSTIGPTPIFTTENQQAPVDPTDIVQVTPEGATPTQAGDSTTEAVTPTTTIPPEAATEAVTSTNTQQPTQEATAILPPRVTPSDPTPTKPAG